MIKKGLVAFILLSVVICNKLSAQDGSYSSGNKLLIISSPTDSKGTDKLKAEQKEDEIVETGLPRNKLPVPELYKDFHINLLSKTKPLPHYYSVDGIYKIDCVYIEEFDYYKLWENNKLNPYGFNGEHFSSSLEVLLYDDERLGSWHMPLDKTIVTSDFGLRRAVWHYGTDMRVKTGQPVYAVFDGVVRISGYDRWGFGRFILLRHKNGLETLYGHLSKNLVRLGQEVKSGEVIGRGGNSGRSTASHLHFEIRYSGNAINPNEIFDFENYTLISSKYTIDQASFAYLEEANKIRYHVIRSGDTLSHLSYRYGVSINKMCQLNGISRNSILRIGQRVRIN